MTGKLTPYRFPCRAVIAPSSDLRQKVEVKFDTEEEMLNAQRKRYEIIEVRDQA